jgi:hypothetical protein
MPFLIVSSDIAVKVWRPKGSNVTLINQSGVDVFFDREPSRLNATAPGTVPNGSKLAANGGEKEFDNWPGAMWFRAISNTTIEVQP